MAGNIIQEKDRKFLPKMPSEERLHLVICVGLSGSGKDYAKKKLLEKYPNWFSNVVSWTTRKPREGEVMDADYHFCSKEEFNKESMIEKVEGYDSQLYGTHVNALSAMQRHSHKIMVVEMNGLNNLIDWNYKMGQPFKIDLVMFNLDEETRRSNMLARGDSLEEVTRRIERDREKYMWEDLRYIFNEKYYSTDPDTEIWPYRSDIEARMLRIESNLDDPAAIIADHFEVEEPVNHARKHHYRFFKYASADAAAEIESEIEDYLDSNENDEMRNAFELLRDIEKTQSVFNDAFEGRMANMENFSHDSAFVVYDALFRDIEDRAGAIASAYRNLYQDPYIRERLSKMVLIGGEEFIPYNFNDPVTKEIDTEDATLVPQRLLSKIAKENIRQPLYAPDKNDAGIPKEKRDRVLKPHAPTDDLSFSRKKGFIVEMGFRHGNVEGGTPLYKENEFFFDLYDETIIVPNVKVRITQRGKKYALLTEDYFKPDFYFDFYTHASSKALIHAELAHVGKTKGISISSDLQDLTEKYASAQLHLFSYYNSDKNYMPYRSKIIDNEDNRNAKMAEEMRSSFNEKYNSVVEFIDERIAILREEDILNNREYEKELKKITTAAIDMFYHPSKDMLNPSGSNAEIYEEFRRQSEKYLERKKQSIDDMNIHTASDVYAQFNIAAVERYGKYFELEIRFIEENEYSNSMEMIKDAARKVYQREIIGNTAADIIKIVNGEDPNITSTAEVSLKNRSSTVNKTTGRKGGRIVDIKQSGTYVIDKRPKAKKRMNDEAAALFKKEPEFRKMVKAFNSVPFFDFAEIDKESFKKNGIAYYTDYFERLRALNIRTDEMVSFKSRKTGRFRANGLYFSGLRMFVTNVGTVGPTVHEVMGHHLDYTSKSLSSARRHIVNWLFDNSRIDDKFASSTKIKKYWHSDVELYARGAECAYALYMGGFRNIVQEAIKNKEIPEDKSVTMTKGMFDRLNERYKKHPDLMLNSFSDMQIMVESEPYLDITKIPLDQLEAFYDYYESGFTGRSMSPATHRRFTNSIAAARPQQDTNTTSTGRKRTKYVYPSTITKKSLEHAIDIDNKKNPHSKYYGITKDQRTGLLFIATNFGQKADNTGYESGYRYLINNILDIDFEAKPSYEILPQIRAISMEELQKITGRKQGELVSDMIDNAEYTAQKIEQSVKRDPFESELYDAMRVITPEEIKKLRGENNGVFQPPLFVFDNEEPASDIPDIEKPASQVLP